MKKVLIIGGGVSGLAAGIFLSRAGIPNEILEKCHMTGGNLTAWSRGGYTIDNCIHWLTGTRKDDALYPLWEEVGALGAGQEVTLQNEFYESRTAYGTVHFYSDLSLAEKCMVTMSPEDRTHLRRFFAAVGAMAKPGRGNSPLRYAALLPFVGMTLGEFSKKLRHPALRIAFSDYLSPYFAAIGLIFAYAAVASGNGGIPLGGSGEMRKRMEDTYRSLGGTVRTGAEVGNILLDRGRVLGVALASGEEIPCRFAVVAVDPQITFGTLLPEKMRPARLVHQERCPEDFFRFSAFQLAFSVPKNVLPFRGVRIIDIEPVQIRERTVRRIVLREFSHEPTFAPAGMTVLHVMIPLDERDSLFFVRQATEHPEEYREEKQALAGLLREKIEGACPFFAGNLELLDVWTPATYARYFGARAGAFMAFGLSGKKAPLRLPLTVRGARGVFFAGQWQQSPGGLPGALLAGKYAADGICRELKKEG